MIRPAAFGYNEETAATNVFQARDAKRSDSEVHQMALAEFDGFVAVLREAGVHVLVVEDASDPQTPDAIFPNNWISFHEDGRVFLYPMLAPTRRGEVRSEVVDLLASQHRFEVDGVVDLTSWAEQELFLEGTGSLVLDHLDRVAYALGSPRTDRLPLQAFCREAGYEPVFFRAADASGAAIYHTNVLLCVGTAFAVVCAEAIGDEDERCEVLERLESSGREVVLIDRDQMASFAGNLLELESESGETLVVASKRALASLRNEQRRAIERYARFVTADLATIEDHGGGSARCMLAEVFLPRPNG